MRRTERCRRDGRRKEEHREGEMPTRWKERITERERCRRDEKRGEEYREGEMPTRWKERRRESEKEAEGSREKGRKKGGDVMEKKIGGGDEERWR